jgi:predicted TIM-barrel fold metal-dependent hydrolase
MIIDSQVHVWAAETPDRPWYSPPSHLPNPFGPTDLLKVMDAAGVGAAVLVPPGWEGGWPDPALDGAARNPDRFAVMGRIATDDPESAALMADWKARPGMLGIRLAFQKGNQSEQLHDGTTDWFWPEAEKHRIPVMFFAPGENETLADHANVHVKMSSVPLYSTEPYPYRNLHGALAWLIGAFGARRAFWGTDLTRIWSLVESYRQCVTLFTEELDFLTADDLDWVMGRGIAQCLDWEISG